MLHLTYLLNELNLDDDLLINGKSKKLLKMGMSQIVDGYMDNRRASDKVIYVYDAELNKIYQT